MVCFGFATFLGLWKTGMNIGQGSEVQQRTSHSCPKARSMLLQPRRLAALRHSSDQATSSLWEEEPPPGAMQLRHKLGLMIVKLERTHDFGSSLFFGGGSR